MDQVQTSARIGPVYVDVERARAELGSLLERARSGQEIVICMDGAPMARLVPLARREPGLLSGDVEDAALEPLPDEELDAWER